MDYPKPLEHECGCKVSWRTYESLAEAEQAAKVAAVKRDADLAEGYDFGYQWPSTINQNDDSTYTVVCP